MEPSLDLQKAIRDRLTSLSVVTSLVPASAILDRNSRPEVFPCILIGEGHTVPDDGLARKRHQTFADLHLWKTEAGLVGVKQIAGAIRQALSDTILVTDHFYVADAYIEQSRFLRDPDGVHSHGVMTVAARLLERAVP